MECNAPFPVQEVVFQRRYHGYLYRRELVNDTAFGGEGRLPMVNCYALDTGEWIGDARTARTLAGKYGIRIFEKRTSESGSVSIGLNPDTKTWYGWSHRAICGFRKGMTVKQGDCTAAYLPIGFKAKTIDDAKQMAIAFAESVS